MQEIKISKERIKKLQKLQQKKYRKIENQMVVEGERALDQLCRNGVKINTVFLLENQKLKYKNLITRLNCEYFCYLDEIQLRKITDTQNPQSIAALVPINKVEINDYRFLLYLDDIKDPGNLGTIIRTATAAGVSGIVVSENSCEIFNPKVVRASLGSVFFIPIITKGTNWLKEQNAQIIVAELENACSVFDFNPEEKNLILVIGSEAKGVSKEIIDISTNKIMIPMVRNIESLNAAVAAGICMYEISNKLLRTKT